VSAKPGFFYELDFEQQKYFGYVIGLDTLVVKDDIFVAEAECPDFASILPEDFRRILNASWSPALR